MENFKKLVRYVGSNSCLLQYPLRSGLNTFSAGVDYEITDKADFGRLMSSEDFIDVTPYPVAKPVVVIEEPVETEEGTLKGRNRGNK